ncbi:ABC transporter ATP-binding protein [Pontibacillus sp. HMF3514]|uniref:ABC transporter ATP-binding protein n=1 Tax=Pontibacillus sp. HMF3514 TaxID=2692425 RepID=UPI00132010D9|nr:ABC transporter ATP-binding protein [Pontibacillus sp. HMF3514]QHE51223.1 ATP-binding cassette domain-containing protein [Pontibacillus sp. HMF3514]
MIQLENVSKTYKSKTVLHPVSMNIEEGKSIGIIGPNGAGKSTFLKLVASLEKPTDGTLSFNGVPYRKNVKNLRKHIGYIPQDIALYEELTVKEQISFWKRVSLEKPDPSFIKQMIRTLRLDEVYKQRVDRLSGGWRRKVNLLVGFMNNPSICLLDEPTAGIDLAAKEDILTWLQSFHNQGKTLLYISHDWYELNQLSDEYLLFAKGRPIVRATREELLREKDLIMEQYPEEQELQNILKFFK